MRICMDRFRKSFSDYSSLAVTAFVIICLLLIKDTGTAAAIRWLAAVFSVSFFLHPYFPKGRMNYLDEGFGLCFGTGLFLGFYLAWTLSALGLCEFGDIVIFASLAVLAAGGFVYKKATGSAYVTKEEFIRFFRGFAIFAVIFLAFFWIIGFNPSVDPGTENYMDFGFMQAIYRQKAAFPDDIWMSGTKLNYYFLGQSAAVYLCRLALTTPEYGYNMMLATFSGMVFLMVFEIVSGVSSVLLKDFPHKDRCVAAGGIFGGSLAAFAANTHWIVYGVLMKGLQVILGTSPSYSYWFPDGTVYINTATGDPDNGKNEFPAYSVVLGDLHAHVINLIFVLPLLAILFGTCFSDKEPEEKNALKKRIYALALISLLLAFYKGSNYWDFAIYYVITGAVIVFCDLKTYGRKLYAILRIAAEAIGVTAASVIFALPFTLNFVKMESGAALCEKHSPAGKLAVLWLIPVAAAVCLMVFLYTEKKDGGQVMPVCRTGLLAFSLCTIGLVAVPEFVYVKDIYEGDNSRFNTMFKLTYQAFTLFAIIAGILFVYLLYRRVMDSDSSLVKSLLIASAVIGVLSVSYLPYAINQWYGNVFAAERRQGISSLECLRPDDVYGFEMEAYDVLMQDERKNINIVEASGDSYSHESALSVYTGACTPAGWYVHEWMWHNDPEPIRDRAERVTYFYTAGNEEYCRNFIKLYEIDYILVGPAEVSRYPVNINGFYKLGDVCLSEIWQDNELALIKVDRSRL